MTRPGQLMKVGRAFHLSMSLENLVLRLNLSLLISWRHFWMKKLNVRFFLILVSLFYVEVSVTKPVFHIWYCTRGFLFRLKNSSSAILI